ncbi:MAG: hypothetical protein JKX85_12355 [Phycisphaeraceae bacterium]|nr:hypothetical protein [Phycisphaeraceae bacterium]
MKKEMTITVKTTDAQGTDWEYTEIVPWPVPGAREDAAAVACMARELAQSIAENPPPAKISRLELAQG